LSVPEREEARRQLDDIGHDWRSVLGSRWMAAEKVLEASDQAGGSRGTREPSRRGFESAITERGAGGCETGLLQPETSEAAGPGRATDSWPMAPRCVPRKQALSHVWEHWVVWSVPITTRFRSGWSRNPCRRPPRRVCSSEQATANQNRPCHCDRSWQGPRFEPTTSQFYLKAS
jgi:hypothetical protein